MISKIIRITVSILLLLFLVMTDTAFAREKNIYLKEDEKNLYIDLEFDQYDFTNLEPGSKVQDSFIVINQAQEDHFQLSLSKSFQHQWLQRHLRGKITIDDRLYDIADCVNGIDLDLASGAEAAIAYSYWLEGADMGNELQQVKGSYRFHLLLRKGKQSSDLPQKTRPSLPMTGMVSEGHFCLIGGALLMMALLITKRIKK